MPTCQTLKPYSYHTHSYPITSKSPTPVGMHGSSAGSHQASSSFMATTAGEKLSPRRRSNGSRKWKNILGRDSAHPSTTDLRTTNDDMMEDDGRLPEKWSMGILNDRLTLEVPGSVLLLSGHHNEPLGLKNTPARISSSSLPPQTPSRRQSIAEAEKRTKDGAIILVPQPDDSHNDPLNWPAWRRDSSLLSLGLYCMVGGGITPILAAGFTNVATDFHVSASQVALTTGLYMMGLGVGGVLVSPTAILFGKRPVYLVTCILFIGTSIWCAASPSYASLLAARVFEGIAVSPVECLPSATIAEIFFLHERAFRIGIYTLLLLGGKNLVPLASAAIIQRFGWRWVFWTVSIVGGFCWILLFLFVPETFWDRTPRPKSRSNSAFSKLRTSTWHSHNHDGAADEKDYLRQVVASDSAATPRPETNGVKRHVDFVSNDSKRASSLDTSSREVDRVSDSAASDDLELGSSGPIIGAGANHGIPQNLLSVRDVLPAASSRHPQNGTVGWSPPTPDLHNFNSPFYHDNESAASDYITRGRPSDLAATPQHDGARSIPNSNPATHLPVLRREPSSEKQSDAIQIARQPQRYTAIRQQQPRRTFVQELRPWNGRLHNDNWFRVAVRPFILYAYPAVLWSAIVYACSVGWLIVLSESVAEIYRNPETYNFSALSTGLIYISPFIGGVLGTAVAGKVSDVIVRFLSKRNGGLYEPEFRLIMAFPVAISTVIGLMGYGWSVTERDAWIVPTVFFGVISFGCSLGSTTAITFVVDSYRQYAGEALVTLNFSKNIFHGLVFSLFFNKWLAADGAKTVFLALGGIQLSLLLLTVPMYIYGKRARMWTVRMNFMERF